MKISFQHTYSQKYFSNSRNTPLLKTNNDNYCDVHPSAITFTSIKNIPNLFFIRMAQYKTNQIWHNKMCKSTEIISSMMQKDMDIKTIIHMAEYCVNIINPIGKIRKDFGVRKTGFNSIIDLINVKTSRGYEYLQVYMDYLKKCPGIKVHIPKSNQEYSQAITCEILAKANSVTIKPCANNPFGIKTNLSLVEKAYKTLKNKKSPTRKEIIDTAATIQWLIAQETPYKRGSDSVANLLTRSLLDSYGIKLSPLKKGVSCDFEAFYRDLDEYIKIYPTLFENKLIP